MLQIRAARDALLVAVTEQADKQSSFILPRVKRKLQSSSDYMCPPSGVSSDRRPLWGPLVVRHRSSHDDRRWEEQSICSTSPKATNCSCWDQRFRGSDHPEIELGRHRRTSTTGLLTIHVELIGRKALASNLHVAVIIGAEPNERGALNCS